MVNNLPANTGDADLISVGKVPMEKEMATHSGILAWEIPWPEDPEGLRSIVSQRVRHD